MPQSHTITSPAPYCFDGITPSKSKYSIGWSSTWTAIRRWRRIEGRALGDGPRHEDAADLEPEVVVEPRGAMALDDEAPAADGHGGLAGRAGRRLGRLREVALAAVFLEGHRVECAQPGRVRATGLDPRSLRLCLGVVGDRRVDPIGDGGGLDRVAR